MDRCAKHKTATQLRCVRCDRPICPRCLVQTPVGFQCGKHKGAPVRTADDLPLTSKFEPLKRPGSDRPRSMAPIGLLIMPLTLVLGPMIAAATGGSFIGVLLIPLIPLVVIYFVARRRR